MTDKIKRINEIRAQLGDELLILAHHYQKDEIVALADSIGDSLKLAQVAEKNKTAKYIVFCGVHFMAETADILTEDGQIVLLPALGSGCPMADMADRKQVERAWKIITAEFGDSITPVTYVNSKAEVKAFCGVHDGTTVTSGNAEKVLKWALSAKDRVLFLPDKNLGTNTAVDLGIPLEHMALYSPKTEELTYTCPKEAVKMILWDGYCFVHHSIKEETVAKVKKENPNAKIAVHPECRYDLCKLVDGKGSTEYLINTVKNSEKDSTWVIGTEINLVNRLIKENPDKNVSILDTNSVCANMNKTTVDNLLETLEGILKGDFSHRITVDKQTAEEAVKSLDTMLSLS